MLRLCCCSQRLYCGDRGRFCCCWRERLLPQRAAVLRLLSPSYMLVTLSILTTKAFIVYFGKKLPLNLVPSIGVLELTARARMKARAMLCRLSVTLPLLVLGCLYGSAWASEQQQQRADCRLLLMGHGRAGSTSGINGTMHGTSSRQGIAARLSCSSPSGPVKISINTTLLLPQSAAFTGVTVLDSSDCQAHAAAGSGGVPIHALLYFCSNQKLQLHLLQPIVQGVVLADGSAPMYNPALLVFGGNVNATITGGWLAHNTAGAALVVMNQAQLTLQNTLVTQHKGTHGRAVLALDNSRVAIDNSTFSNMTAAAAAQQLPRARSVAPQQGVSAALVCTAQHRRKLRNACLNSTRWHGGAQAWHCITTARLTSVGACSSTMMPQTLMLESVCMTTVRSASLGAASLATQQANITQCSFKGNNASESDGGVGAYDNTRVHIDGSSFIGNTAGNGGGLGVWSTAQVYVTACAFEQNNATGYGAGVASVNNGKASVTGGVFEGNQATEGAAMSVRGKSKATLAACAFRKNSAVRGGAIDLQDQGHANITNCSFTANEADDSAGAIYARLNSTFNVTATTLDLNQATRGGAMALYDTASATVTGTVCSGNSVQVDGGCVHMESSQFLCIINSTLSGNRAVDSGGALSVKTLGAPPQASCC
ncbi:hypothetical protein COO60DRAFT_407427 [Scenedesmus sp. NREL 46B-D3]|nr:hypothetical protein COO60DRAFT_407427 [Scenedesmus sp. NREL 46B-D3]